MSQPDIVRFNDFTSTDTRAELAAVDNVLRSGWYVLGPQVTAFEQQWARRCDAEHAVGVGNGLDAIEIGLRSLGIGPGDEVITTPMTAVATILGVLRAGATPVLADIDPTTGLLSPEGAARCVTGATKAVMPVHLYGQMRGMQRWSEFCTHHGLALIEDCAQSHDASDGGRKGGRWGEFGAYSFYPTKNLGAVGDAGALVTDSDTIASIARSLRNYGQTDRYVHSRNGMNSRLDELQAAILSTRLQHLSEWTERRRTIANAYREGISNPDVDLLAPPIHQENHVYHLFVVLTDRRTELMSHLSELGVETLIHYPIPAHLQEPLRGVKLDPIGLTNAEGHAERCLSLPCAPHLSDVEVERVIDAVNSFSP